MAHARSEEPPLRRQNPGVRIDQDRVSKTEFADARRDLNYLHLGMRSRVSRVRDQPIERPILHVQRPL